MFKLHGEISSTEESLNDHNNQLTAEERQILLDLLQEQLKRMKKLVELLRKQRTQFYGLQFMFKIVVLGTERRVVVVMSENLDNTFAEVNNALRHQYQASMASALRGKEFIVCVSVTIENLLTMRVPEMYWPENFREYLRPSFVPQ